MTKALSIEEAALNAMRKEIRPLRDGEALPEPVDEATATANEASVTVPATPLPWSIDGDLIVGVDDQADACIGTVFGACSDLPEIRTWGDANAKFIVTACNAFGELVKAAEAIRAFHDSVFVGHALIVNGQTVDHTQLNLAAMHAEQALDLIAKAEGRE